MSRKFLVFIPFFIDSLLLVSFFLYLQPSRLSMLVFRGVCQAHILIIRHQDDWSSGEKCVLHFEWMPLSRYDIFTMKFIRISHRLYQMSGNINFATSFIIPCDPMWEIPFCFAFFFSISLIHTQSLAPHVTTTLYFICCIRFAREQSGDLRHFISIFDGMLFHRREVTY